MFVGDRGMITQAHAHSLKEQGVDFISALKSAQIRSLVNSGELQLSLFDEVNLAEITSPRSPASGSWCAATRPSPPNAPANAQSCWPRPSTSSTRSRRWSPGPAERLRAADAGTIGQRAGRVVNKYKVAKHFTLDIADGHFAYQRNTEQITNEAALDGLYVIRTTLPADRLGAPAAVRAYKQLKLAEHAFRTMKDTIEIRPIHHHLADRVRAHVFLCMLAYYVAFELQQRLTPLLFTDDTPLAPTDPVKPATRSPSARAKAGSARTADGLPRPHPPRPARRPRHHLPQPDPHRPATHLPAPDHTHPAPSPRPTPARHQAPHVAKAKPTRNTRIPRHHAGFNVSTVKTSA